MINKIEGDAALLYAAAAERPARPKEPEQPAAPAAAAAPDAPTAPPMPSYGFRLRVDEQTHEVIAVIVDPETRAVIREIPPEEMQVASKVIRNLIGPIVDKVV